MAGTYYIKRFLKKTPGTENKTRNGVITLSWRLRLQ